MEWEAVIGLEVHAQLLTRSKMFCACAADYQTAPPNTRVCPVCLGMPGSLPVINRRAVEMVIATGLALHCTINEHTKFDRKNYPYPDLMKGYQISQYDQPIASSGYVEIVIDGKVRRIGVTRVHLEEDVAKLMHVRGADGEPYTLMDVNRAGVPLMEMVGEPDIRSAEEARLYLMQYHSVLQYIGVSTADMEKGAFRCDANISVRPRGNTQLSSKVEVKNMNSFRAVVAALEYEFDRQVKVVESGGRIVQETRGWVEERKVTVSQRSKEQAHDYRYFPEPDLPPLVIPPSWTEEVRARLPELPVERRDRFEREYGLSRLDASQTTLSRATADYFEAAVDGKASRAKAVANWINGDITRLANAAGVAPHESKVSPAHVAELVDLIQDGTLSVPLAKTTLEEVFQTGQSPRAVAQAKGYVQVSDVGVIEAAVAQAILQNPQAVQDFMKGKETAAKFLVGQVMKITKGKANPAVVNRAVVEQLKKRV